MKNLGLWIARKWSERQARKAEWRWRDWTWRVKTQLGLEAFSLADQVIFEAARQTPAGASTLSAAIVLLGEERIAQILSYIIEPTPRVSGGKNIDQLRDFPAEWALEALGHFFTLNPKLCTYLMAGWASQVGLRK
jgi:hypothetical protein